MELRSLPTNNLNFSSLKTNLGHISDRVIKRMELGGISKDAQGNLLYNMANSKRNTKVILNDKFEIVGAAIKGKRASEVGNIREGLLKTMTEKIELAVGSKQASNGDSELMPLVKEILLGDNVTIRKKFNPSSNTNTYYLKSANKKTSFSAGRESDINNDLAIAVESAVLETKKGKSCLSEDNVIQRYADKGFKKNATITGFDS